MCVRRARASVNRANRPRCACQTGGCPQADPRAFVADHRDRGIPLAGRDVFHLPAMQASLSVPQHPYSIPGSPFPLLASPSSCYPHHLPAWLRHRCRRVSSASPPYCLRRHAFSFSRAHHDYGINFLTARSPPTHTYTVTPLYREILKAVHRHNAGILNLLEQQSHISVNISTTNDRAML